MRFEPVTRVRTLVLTTLTCLALSTVAIAAPSPSKDEGGPPRNPNVAGLKAACMADSRPGSWCAGYLQGAADSIVAFSSRGHSAGLWHSQVPPGDLGGLFIAWALRNPKYNDAPMLLGANMAFSVH